MKSFGLFFLSLLLIGCSKMESKAAMETRFVSGSDNLDTATFAAGCFWCMVAPFESIDGVSQILSGYSGGTIVNPTYEQVCEGNTGHYEAIQIVFDPAVISYAELLDVYWKQFDPTDSGGSFHDRGQQYESAIFYRDKAQKASAEKSVALLAASGIFPKPLATKILPFTSFYPAEEYHQDYHKKNPLRYNSYRAGSGRDRFIVGVWGDRNIDRYEKPSPVELKKKLTATQYEVTQNRATEAPYKNEFWNSTKAGIYVDVVSGEPLFCSKDQFECGSGWPSFTKPIDTRYVAKKSDSSHGMKRVEVRSKFGDSHLGHVFDDGPDPTHLRYCINSASLRFVPKEEMEKQGYGEYLWLFNK